MPILRDDFTDRKPQIEALETARLTEGITRRSLVCLHGQPGIGKTQLLAWYQRLSNLEDRSNAYIDLTGRNYLSVIDQIVFELGGSGFETLEEALDRSLEIMENDRDAIVRQLAEILEKQANVTQDALQASGVAGIVFNQPVSAQTQYFINGQVTFNNAKVELIFNIERKEPEKILDDNRDRITKVFFDCLRQVARQKQVILLLDHLENANDALEPWLNQNLLEPAANLAFMNALIVVARKDLPALYVGKAGVKPVAVPPFTIEVARDYWSFYGLPQAELDRLGPDIYSYPSRLSLEAVAASVKHQGSQQP